jgi:peptide/nickel transport system permease protein
MLVLVVWTATTVNFVVPRLVPVNPVQIKMQELIRGGGVHAEEVKAMAAAWEEKFGLDQPLWKQYVNYLSDLAHLDLGYSLESYPKRVLDMITEALPWTIRLLFTATVLSYAIGAVLGAAIAWRRSPRFLQYLVPFLMTVSAVPYYIFSLILIYLLAVHFRIFPLYGGHSVGVVPTRSIAWYLDIARHSVLPAMSIILSWAGHVALNTRGLMITVQGEDYMALAESKGLKNRRIFVRYGLRNALLPVATSLALSLGFVVSGSVVVERLFGYPGVGGLLFGAITFLDYNVIYGVVLVIILSIGLSTFLMDLTYPLIDPRISYAAE